MANIKKHDGDCWIYAVNGVCTCGYFHEIIFKNDEEELDKNEKLITKHLASLHYLNSLEDTIIRFKT